MKNIIKTILLVIVVLFPLELVSASHIVNGINYDFTGDNATVLSLGYGSSYSGNIIIPETVIYNGTTYVVTTIGNSSFRGSSITNIVMPSTITAIWKEAFYNCDNLSEVILPNSLSYIGEHAFSGCDNLKSIFLPNSLTWIDKFAFFTYNLEDIYCYPTNPSSIYMNELYASFDSFSATLHVPAASLAAYFTAPVWCNFENIVGDAIEPTSISISKDSIGIYLDHQFQLNATIIPANTTTPDIVWLSTNSFIATVEDGLVSAVGLGECDIIAYSLYGYKAICHVSVTEEKAIINLDRHEAMVLPNHMLTIIPTVTPTSVDLMVTSSDPTVAAARFVNGKVQVVGIKEGSTTITVNTPNGNAQPDSCLITVYTEKGDLNCDGFINISDVTAMIDYLLSGNSTNIKIENADVNKDNGININDVTTLIDYLLNGRWPWEHDPNDYVDLGLPSGTLWATCNVGANYPEDDGNHFAWGETEITYYQYWGWSTYKWCNGSDNSLTKYCNDSNHGYNGFVDNKMELELEDDAAYVNWGHSWRMPSLEQQQELIDNCTWQWTQRNGVNGSLVTGPNGNTMFLPAAASYWGNSLIGSGRGGYYWSRTLDPTGPYDACYLFFGSNSLGYSYYCIDNFRFSGHTVRAVRVSQN